MSSRPSSTCSRRPSGHATFTSSTEHFNDMTSRLGATSFSTRKPRARAKTAVSTLGGSGDQQIICAITESRGISPTVGLAFVNLATTEAVLCQIADNQTYVRTLHKLHVLEPTEIFIPNTAAAPVKSKLIQVLETNLDFEAPLTPLFRRYWDESSGSEYIEQLAFKEDIESIKVSVGGNYFATCCLAAACICLKYIELGLAISFAHHSMRIRYEPSEGSMMIDLATMHSLELIQNLQNPKSKDCLFGLLNQTLTPMGSRLLRCNILQPQTEKSVIEKRYAAVEELVTHEASFSAVRQALRNFQDVDKVLTEIVIIPFRPSLQKWEVSINNVILLRQYVRLVPLLHEALEGLNSDLFRQIREICAPTMIENVCNIVDAAINEDVSFQRKPLDLRNQRTYAVRAGQNGLLEVARQTYKEASQDAVNHMNELADTYNLNLDLKYDPRRHFFLSMPASELEERDLPPAIINVYRRKSIVECQTLDLIKLNQKINDSHHEVLQMSDRIVQEVIESVRADVAPLFRISESIATVDMLASFAQVATSQDYCRPELTSTLAIKSGRHPIHEKIRKGKFVPNDVYATQQARFQIITGCNMSGKSTYIRSVALMTIMAQVGSFVPAMYASFPIRHQLFARLSLDDSSTSNISTFASEMREAAFILHNVDRRSLVIMDELGRGTSSRDGLAIALAIAEALIQSRATVWFVTHFVDMARFLAERAGVVSLHLAAQIEEQGRMKMLYRIAQGPVQEVDYGIALAKVIGLWHTILEQAQAVSTRIRQTRETQRKDSRTLIESRKKKLFLGLEEHLVQVRGGSLDGGDLKNYLERLQDEFVRRFSELEDEEQGIKLPEQSAETASTFRSTTPLTTSNTNNGLRAVVTDALPISSATEAEQSATMPILPVMAEVVKSPPASFAGQERDSCYLMCGAL